jgi:hypothetical protein
VGNLTGAAADQNNVGGNGTNDGTGNDGATYIASDRPQQGQTFTTGAAAGGYRVKAVWLRHVGYAGNSAGTFWQTANGSTLTVRVTKPSATGTPSFALRAETVTTTGTETGAPNAFAPQAAVANTLNGTGVWLRFTFSTPVELQANTQYGFDVTSSAGGFFFETLGLRDAATGGNPYPAGSAYRGTASGVADNTLNVLTGDRVFVVEMDRLAPPLTAPLTLADPFPLNRVRLLPSRFKSNQELHRTGYLAWISPDRLLHPFRANAGLPQPAGVTHLGGWEGTSGFTAVRGHMAGHYLTAASRMSAATGDASFLPKIQYLVAELKKCQDALATRNDASGRSLSGYLSAFPISYFEVLETNHNSAQVPFYTIHKIIAGLVDAYRYGGVNEALDLAIRMADYHQGRVSRMTATKIEEMFRTDAGNSEEWGGMNETLADIYLLSQARGDANPERHLQFAQIFHRDWFINPLVNQVDELNGLHANTHVPQVVGFARAASILNPEDSQRTRLYAAADSFWNLVLNQHWLVLGGNSYSEHFHAAGKETGLNGSGLSVATAETCNTYNMLKLTSELFQRSPAPAYADYYEHALYNHILASLAPDTGMPAYFVPMISGHFKTYSQPEGSSWCCTGSGIENTSAYNQAIYFHKGNALWVNLFIPSTLDWSEQGIGVRLETSFPASEKVQLTITCAAPKTARIRVRIPSWISSAPTVTVNGVAQPATAAAGSYVEIDRTWANGDIIEVTLPMALRLDRSMDDPTQVSLFHGPVLLAGSLGTSGMPASDQAQGQLDYSDMPRVTAPLMIAGNRTDLAGWVQSEGQPLRYSADVGYAGDVERSSILLQPFYDIHHTRYAVYWKLLAPAGLRTWTGGGASSTWSSAGNWDALPSAGYALRFASATGGTSSNNFLAGQQFNGIEFAPNAGASVLSGNRITLQGDIRNSSQFGQRINLPLEFKNGISWEFDATGGELTLGGAITGTGILNKRGGKTLTLVSDASLSGSVHVSEGAFQIGDGGTTGSISSPISLAEGSSLVFNRSDAVEVSAAISGSGHLIKKGAGTARLLAPSSHTGPVSVERGALRLGSTQVQRLAHRWSFNGSLADSAGNSNATLVDAGANNATLSSTEVVLTGGAKSASDYVSLGSGLLPKDGSPVTLELWATQVNLQAWSRIFDVGSSINENLFMSWSQETANTDRLEWKDGATNTANNTVAPFSPGTEYHLVFMIEPGAGANGTTRVTWYAAPSAATTLGEAKGSFSTTNTLAELADTNFWVGRSHYEDRTASARYNEVRLWTRTFSTAELADLHNLGPNSVGTYATQTTTGSLANATHFSLGTNAEFDIGGTTQQVSSLAGAAGSTIRLGSGQLVIRAGADSGARFAGSFAGQGSIGNRGTLRLVGDAALPEGISLVNHGVLDIMTWRGALPGGFVNQGVVLDRSAVAVKDVTIQQTDVKLMIDGYSGHTYQLQGCDDLTSWTDLGAPVEGRAGPIIFTDPARAAAGRRFYRVVVDP